MNKWFEALDEVVEVISKLSHRGLIVLIIICAASVSIGMCLATAVIGVQ